MFNRMKTLVLLQLDNRYRYKSKRALIAKLAVKTGVFVICTLVMFGVLYLLKYVVNLPVTKDFLLFVLALSQYVGIAVTTIGLKRALYDSNDNAILFAFPAKHSEVFYSKLAVFYIGEFSKSLFFLLPLFLAFGFLTPVSAWFFVNSALMIFVLPTLTVLIAALLCIPLMYLSKFFRRFPAVYAVLLVAVAVLLFAGLTSLLVKVPKPLRIVAIYNTIINGIVKVIVNSNRFALFYSFAADILFLKNVGLNWLFLLALLAALLVCNSFLARPLFFRMVASSSENAVEKKHRTDYKTKGEFGAFLFKELTLAKRNIGRVLNNYLLLFVMPFLMYSVNHIFGSIELSSRGNALVFGVNMLIGLAFVTASNSHTATALSEEGGEFVLLKTAPGRTYKIAFAKIVSNLVVSSAIIVVTSALMFAFGSLAAADAVFLVLCYLFVNVGHILWSLELDIKNPQLREFASTGHFQNNKNVSASIVFGLVTALLFGALSAVLYFFMGVWSQMITLALALIFVAVRFYLFNLNMKCLFERIEF